ncbi:MAG: asparagine synthase-related protein, partial [Planctomycetota bacterium]
MAGWCVVWEGGAAACDPARWAETLRLAARAGERVQSCRAAGYALAAWARPRGEFRCSGRILEPAVGTRVAWLGQVRERDQDVSARAAATLADERTTHDQVAGLNGPFASAAVQRAGRGIALWTDRHRHYPIYMVRSGDRLVAATDLLCLRPWLVRRELDRQVLDLLLRTGECLDRTCLVTGVEILPPATCAGLRDGRYFEQRYWAFRFEAQRGLKPADCAMEAGRRLHAAVLNVEATGARLGVPLSGGLDSRFLLGLCRAPQKVPSFTWGAPGCRDIRYGRNVAAAFGSPHRIRTWAPEAFVPLWQEGVARTGGATGVDEMYLLPFVELLAGHCDAILDGLAGDALLGGNFLKWRWLRARSLSELAAASWRWRVSPAEDDCIDRLLPGCEPGAARRTWLASIMARGDGRPVERFNEWLFENRVFRHANCGTLLVRGGVEAHAPFFDRD